MKNDAMKNDINHLFCKQLDIFDTKIKKIFDNYLFSDTEDEQHDYIFNIFDSSVNNINSLMEISIEHSNFDGNYPDLFSIIECNK